MDIKKNVLLIALAVVSYLLLLAWREDYPQLSVAEQTANIENSAEEIPVTVNDLPTAVAAPNNQDDLPVVQNTTSNATSGNLIEESQNDPATQLITVSTPFQVVTIDPYGGDIIGVALKEYPTSLETPENPFQLLYRNNSSTYVTQSGLVGPNGPDANTEGRPLYISASNNYELLEQQSELQVDLQFSDNNINYIKRYSFSPDDYLISLEYIVENQSDLAWQGNLFGQIKRDATEDPSGTGNFGALRNFFGAVLTTEDDPYVKYKLDDLDDGTPSVEIKGGWIGFSQHYFLSSWIPDAESTNTFSTRKNSAGEYLLTFVSASNRVEPGQTGFIKAGFWAGPKDQYRLEEIAPNLELTIDYGWFFFIASPIFWLLTQINNQIGNYGFSILLLTVVIKTILFPLSAKSYYSSAKMRKLQPKILDLKEKYGEDKQKFMQAQMDLWSKEKVNPFGGCLPMLMQMPVFLGIFWVLNESVELRQASFILWYDDLSKMDPFYILPLLMGATMFVQQTLTPMQMSDPAQAKVMKFMPILFTVFFLWFPAGLVLYYTANSFLSILQQWYITKKVERTYKPKGT